MTLSLRMSSYAICDRRKQVRRQAGPTGREHAKTVSFHVQLGPAQADGEQEEGV